MLRDEKACSLPDLRRRDHPYVAQRGAGLGATTRPRRTWTCDAPEKTLVSNGPPATRQIARLAHGFHHPSSGAFATGGVLEAAGDFLDVDWTLLAHNLENGIDQRAW